MKRFVCHKIVLLFLFIQMTVQAANTSSSAGSASLMLVAQPVQDKTVSFNVSDTGEYMPIIWGLDLAWLSEENIRRGIAYMGKDNVDIVRSSFTPTSALVDDELQEDELAELNERLDIINTWLGPIDIALNDDHPSVDSYFYGNPENWVKLYEITAKHHEDAGHNVVTISPFNEPDVTSTGQGTLADFYKICAELKSNSYFDSIRISGGNTCNDDYALEYYDSLKSYLDEGNTHQLAGTFDNYAEFYETVRANGHHATNDEMHNVMEAMVGVEYGLQTGIWWGTAEYARGEFVKASDGRRLGYAEHRENWTAASVYRNPDGDIQAFAGASERQAYTTIYKFFSKERDVYFDGYGPQREYCIEVPGGTGYQKNQPNAERVVNITWGNDIQPVIDGRYILANRSTGKILEVNGGSTENGASLQQGLSTGESYQQWDVSPVIIRVGGDFSYFNLTDVNSEKYIDVYNSTLENGGDVIVWDSNGGNNQQWFLEYAEDGWFYIRNRQSAKCLDVSNDSITDGVTVLQWEYTGEADQQWRFLPVNADVEFDAPAAPANLVATGNAESIRLDWTANTESDVAGYSIYRSETSGGDYELIARNITTNAFVDNTTTNEEHFYYVVKAVDSALNHSAYSDEVSASATGDSDMVVCYKFENDLLDNSNNLNHCVSYGNVSYVEGMEGKKAVKLNGSSSFLQLPSYLANQEEISISAWIYWNGYMAGQHVFDFGNSASECMFLSPNIDLTHMQFAIINGDKKQTLDADAIGITEWTHVVVSLGGSVAKMYVNGELAAETDTFSISPIDFKPLLNYIGRGQEDIYLFNGYLDDFRVYNYALSSSEIAAIVADTVTSVENIPAGEISLWPNPVSSSLNIDCSGMENWGLFTAMLYDINGQLVLSKGIANATGEIDVSCLPQGIYLLKLCAGNETRVQKIVVACCD